MEGLLQQRVVIRVGDNTGAILAPVSRVSLKTRSVSVRSFGSGRVRSICRGLRAVPDGIAPGNAESGARDEFVEQAKTESASALDAEQEPFRDSVESGQTIGEATTAQQFGADHVKSAEETITNQNKELLEQSKSNGKPEPVEEDDPETEKEEVASDVWGSKDDSGGTHAFLDDSQQIEFHGEDDDSMLGIGGQRAGESQM